MMRFKFNALAKPQNGEASIRLYSEIGDSFWGESTTASEFADLLDGLGDVSKINLYVNSPGGDVFDAQAMLSALNRHPASVHVTVDGLMASAATFFLGAADEVTMGQSSELMIHDAWSVAFGNAGDMRKTADVLDMLSDQIAGIYAKRAGGTQQSWREAMLSESWFSAQEAVDAGLADDIAETEPEPANAAALASFQFAGRKAAGFPAAAFAALKPRPVAVGTMQERPAQTKENTVTDTETKELDGNAIDALLEFKFNAFESKHNATNEAAMQKFIDAMEPVPTIQEVRDSVLADMRKKSGPSYGEVLNMIASRRNGSATEEQLAGLKNLMGSTRETVFRDAFTYGSGGTNLQEQQFIGELVAKVAYSPVVWDLIGHDDLTGPTVYGGAATTLPAGGTYAGGGAVVSSTAPVWAQESLTALLYALAAGLPRINFDFGQEAALLNSFFRYALADYYKWRDTQTITKILGTSTGFFGALTAGAAPAIPTNSVIQDAIAKIAAGIVNVAKQGGGLSNFGLITEADFTSLMEASKDQAPAFWNVDLGALTSGQAEGKFAIRLDATGTLTTGQVLVGNGLNGMTGYELGNSPVRVEQVVTATGTIDTGIFGYVAPLRENANFFSLVSTVTSAA